MKKAHTAKSKKQKGRASRELRMPRIRHHGGDLKALLCLAVELSCHLRRGIHTCFIIQH